MDVRSLSGSDEHVLVVDNEPQVARLLTVMLKRMGYRVTVEGGGHEAFETFKARPDIFDIVITDQTMPDLTGIELSKKISQIRPDLPILLCTGFSETVCEEKAQQYGVRKFLLKPLEKQTLSQTLRELLSEKET
jgi:CheY-like chemotaxis protein